MKNIPKSIIFLLIISFSIRVSIGIITGAADDDSGDYVTYAIQTAHDNAFRNFIDFNSGRQVFQLWLFCLVCFMKLFGATNNAAILITSLAIKLLTDEVMKIKYGRQRLKKVKKILFVAKDLNILGYFLVSGGDIATGETIQIFF